METRGCHFMLLRGKLFIIILFYFLLFSLDKWKTKQQKSKQKLKRKCTEEIKKILNLKQIKNKGIPVLQMSFFFLI